MPKIYWMQVFYILVLYSCILGSFGGFIMLSIVIVQPEACIKTRYAQADTRYQLYWYHFKAECTNGQEVALK